MEDRQLGRAWLALSLAILLHVTDEALTGFLSVYNPTVVELRARIPWLPLFTFRPGIWLGGLLAGIALLILLSPLVYRGVRWTRPVAYALATIMIVNALSHTAGTIAGRTFASIRFPRPMPGFYSSPILLAASIYLLYRLRKSAGTRQGG